ncbi:sensor histidine kinase [Corynebacterium sp. 335C]
MTEHAPADAPAPAGALARPRAAWARLGDPGKVALYMRASTLLLVLACPVMALVFAVGTVPPGVTPPLAAAVAAVVIAVHVPALAVAELHPSLNVRPRRPVGRARLLAEVLPAVTWAAGLALRLAGGPDPAVVVSWAGQVLLLGGAIAACAGALPWRPRPWLTTAALSAATLALTVGVAGFGGGLLPFIVAASVLTAAWYADVVRQLDAARRTEAAMRVNEERLRFAQELHDTMGRHLAAMSLKTQLAIALAQRGDDRLMDELRALQELTRTSASDMREVVAGYRSANLATELEGARSLLRSAGVDARVDGGSLDVPPRHRELAAWFVREAATNVLRHSSATTVRITAAPDRVAVVNDGAPDAPGPEGGLGALRTRAAAAGAELRAEARGGTFTAELRLPRDEQEGSAGDA